MRARCPARYYTEAQKICTVWQRAEGQIPLGYNLLTNRIGVPLQELAEWVAESYSIFINYTHRQFHCTQAYAYTRKARACFTATVPRVNAAAHR